MPLSYTVPWGLKKQDPNDPIDVIPINDSFDLINLALSQGMIISPVNSSLFIDNYPPGISMFPLTSTTIAADANWAVGYNATQAEVVTFKPATDRATQFWFRNGSSTEGFYRHGTTTNWTPWREFGGQDSCAIDATADVVIPDNQWTRMSETTVETVHGYAVAYNNGGILCRTAGLYRVEITIAANGNVGTSIIYVGFGQLLDAGPPPLFRLTMNPGTGACVINGSWTKVMAAGETVYIFVQHITGASKTFNNRRLVVNRVSPAP